MLKTVTYILLSTVVTLFAYGCQASPNTTKPQGPLTITIAPEGEVVTGEAVSFLVTVTSRIAAPRLRVLVHPPGDMELVNGALQWEGAIARGGSMTLQFSGRFSDKHPNTIAASAHIAGPGGGGMGSRAEYHLGPLPAEKAAPQGRVIPRHGEEILEVPLKP